ncbi:hypothetical protein D3C73_1293610 [compost metagenome]
MPKESEYFKVALAVSRRFQYRLLKLDIMMPVRAVQIGILEGRGCRQHQIGVFRRIGQEQIMHDREQVLPFKAALHPLQIGCDNKRIAAVDE